MEFTSMDESEIAAGLLLKAPRLADLEFVVNIQDQLTKFAKLGQILARPRLRAVRSGPLASALVKILLAVVEDPGMPSSPRCLGGVQ